MHRFIFLPGQRDYCTLGSVGHWPTDSKCPSGHPFRDVSCHWLLKCHPSFPQTTKLWGKCLHSKIKLELCPSTSQVPGHLWPLNMASLGVPALLATSSSLLFLGSGDSKDATSELHVAVAQSTQRCCRDLVGTSV